jgi:transcriptional regulator with XRE-family HTH domain
MLGRELLRDDYVLILEEAMIKKKMTKEDIAEKANITGGTVTEVFKGKSSRTCVIKVAVALDVPAISLANKKVTDNE